MIRILLPTTYKWHRHCHTSVFGEEEEEKKIKKRKRECFRFMADQSFFCCPCWNNTADLVQHLPHAFGNKTIPETFV
jgi:hypothetical protein